MSGRSLKRVWKVSGKPGLDRFSPVCPGRYWVVSECCLYIMGGVWKVNLRIGTVNFPLVVCSLLAFRGVKKYPDFSYTLTTD